MLRTASFFSAVMTTCEDKVMPPLGILYLCAWLRKHGHDPHVIDLAGVDDWKSFLATRQVQAKLDDSQVVGYSCTTPQYPVAQQIASHIRSCGYTVPQVVGGIHTTSLAHANEMDFLERDGFDVYCIGEGYNSVLDLCRGIAETGHTPGRLLTGAILPDVNLLPFAARDLIDINSYKYKLGDVPTATHYTQYGCPYACQYCESPMAGSWTVRAMTPERIQAEVKQVRDDFGIHGAMFFDDEMNLSQDRMLHICERLKELGDIVWRGFVVTAKFNRELAEACKNSGCHEIASGIESGSPDILRNIRKPATVAINSRFVKTAKAAGLRVKAFLIVGLPGESWRTIRETDRWLDGLRREGYAPDDIDVSILQIYNGSPLYQAPQDVLFDPIKPELAYYKSSPDSYLELVQVRTSRMSKYDLVAGRNYLESKWKHHNWIKDYSDRHDLDEVYSKNAEVAESIRYAAKQIASQA